MNLIFRFNFGNLLPSPQRFKHYYFMKNYQLQTLFEIPGIGSASGLVNTNGVLYIISDNSTFLYRYDMNDGNFERIQLSENYHENIPKKIKPDFESITLKGNKLVIFGSGSTTNRNKIIAYNLKTKQITEKDLTDLYEKLRSKIGLSSDELNIEGAFYYERQWYFFQRGNGATSQNGIFIVDKKNVTFVAVSLPKIKEIEATFTDAILVGDLIYFLAAVENTTSTYDDGEILGCFMGAYSLKSNEVLFIDLISSTNKFEGITLLENNPYKIDFLLCEDNDTADLKTIIYKLSIISQ